jgi:lysophospholipase L1-like esterase
MTSNLDALRARAQSAEPILWNWLGDSITHGALHTWGERDYVQLFAEQIRFRLGRHGDLVLNAAFSGYRVTDVARELQQRCLRFQPEIVSIAIGMNDSAAGRAGLAAFRKEYADVIARIRNETTALLFLQTQNGTDARNATERTLAPYMDAVRELGAKLDVPVCDQHAVWQRYEQSHSNAFALLSDPIHPNAWGHRLMADVLLRWLGYGPLQGLSPLEGFDPQL